MKATESGTVRCVTCRREAPALAIERVWRGAVLVPHGWWAIYLNSDSGEWDGLACSQECADKATLYGE